MRHTGDSRHNVGKDDARARELTSASSNKETKDQMDQFHQARTVKLSADSLPRQKVHDHATLYLAADALGHWKEVAAQASAQRIKYIRDELIKRRQKKSNNSSKSRGGRRNSTNSNSRTTSSPPNERSNELPKAPISSSSSSSKTITNGGDQIMVSSSGNGNGNTNHQFNTYDASASIPSSNTTTTTLANHNTDHHSGAPNYPENNNSHTDDDDDTDESNSSSHSHNDDDTDDEFRMSRTRSSRRNRNSSSSRGGPSTDRIINSQHPMMPLPHIHHPHSQSIVDASRPSDRVLVINVGGTLGMWPDPSDGRLRPKKGFLLDQMLNLHELRFNEVPVFDFIEYHELVDSSDVNSVTWETLARDIYEHIDDYSGILVAHGTDTLHYTAAALSFALERLAKPVIVMGSMIPLCELYTDTRRNVTAALRFAGCGQWLKPAVYVFFHEQLFYGTRCVKFNDSLKAFESPNSPSAADLNTLRFIRPASSASSFLSTSQQQQQKQETNRLNNGNRSRNNNNSNNDNSNIYTHDQQDPSLQVYSDSFYSTLAATSYVTVPLSLRAKFSDRVLCLGIVPDLVLSEACKLFTARNHSKYRNNITLPRAIVLKVPEMNIKSVSSNGMAASLQTFGASAAASGCAVFATSSAPSRGLSPSTIACLLKFVPDVVPLNDMLPETAVVKAMWLLGEMLMYHSNAGSSSSLSGGSGGNFSDSSSLENFKRMMFVNLRGEVTETAKSIPRPVWLSRL